MVGLSRNNANPPVAVFGKDWKGGKGKGREMQGREGYGARGGKGREWDEWR